MKALIRGEEVEIPRYNFITGTRGASRDKNSALSSDGIIIVEGLHLSIPNWEKISPEEKNSKFM